MAEVLSPPTEFAQSDDPFADLIPEGSGNLGITPEQQNPFADLLKREDDLAPSAAGAYENLVGGGTPDAPAYQKVGQNFSPVPRGVAVSTTDLGPFSDLVQGQEKPITNYAEQFGSFADLVPPDLAPYAAGELPGAEEELAGAQREVDLHQRQMADIERGPIDWFKKFAVDFGETPLINIPPAAVKAIAGAALGLPTGLPDTPAVEGLSRSGAQTLSSLTSPQNIALLASVGSAPAVVQKAVSLGFTAYASAHMGKEIALAQKEKDPTKFFEHVGNAVTQGAFATLAGVHGISGGKAAAKGGELRDASKIESTAAEIGGEVRPQLGEGTPLRQPYERPAGEVTPEAIAPEAAPAEAPGVLGEKLNLRYEGLQDYEGVIPNEHLYTVMEEGPAKGATFGVKEGGGLPELKARLEETKAKFKAEPPKVAEQFTPAPEVQELLKQAAPTEPAPEAAPPAEPKLQPAAEFVPRDKKAPTAITVMNRKFVGKTEAEAWKAAHEGLKEELGTEMSEADFRLAAQQEPDFQIIERPKPESDKDFARRQKEERSAAAQVERDQRKAGDELFKAIEVRGGLPGKTSKYWTPELERLWQNPKARRLFRKDAKAPDEGLRLGLEEAGFRFETVDDMLTAIEQRTLTGKKQFAAGALELGEAPEGGALFGRGGKRPGKPKPIGATPMGDKNFLRIPTGAKRFTKGLFTEGARHTLGRVKNKVGRALGKATRKHVDVEQALYGEHDAILRKAFESVPAKRLDAAATEASQFFRDKENKRPTAALQPDAQRLVDAWYEVWRKTGDIARANNVQVWDAAVNKYRSMGTAADSVPRMFRQEVEKVLKDPESNAPLFDQLANDLATHRGITPEEAATELRGGIGARFSANDHFSNIEMARTEQLPESFYEYDIRNIAARYLPAFSERMAQIIAFGQRLGPREAPVKPNLWDVARKEAQDTYTVEWLNAAEDQAIGFHRKSTGLRTARRAQALGNATLLSDPTTTVMRNLLSGLSVTTERFGVGRSLRAMISAGRELSRADARTVGVMRDDIGQFLGAEQLGDTKVDNFIRSFQQKALTISGFSPSEGIVRAHGAATASQFARDVAKALAKDPTSRLAREGLAQFKRTDVDPNKILAEKGEWRTGEETRKFIRTSVRDSQGGYRYDQVPVFAGTTAGRFLYQYGRWAIQRAGDIMRNTVKPALLGETVEFRGQRMRRRNVMPLMRLGFSVIGLGEAFAGIASGLFGRDRRDASFDEISEAFSEDEGRAVGLLAERITNDIIMAGTLGLISQPIDFIKSTKDQSRFKNPFEPPSLAGLKAVLGLAQKAYDQGGSLTKRDLLDASTALVRGAKNITDVVRHQVGEQLYESQNDQRTLRNAARRWAKEQGMDVTPASGFGDYRKSPRAPVFEAINDALLSGDAAEAKAVADHYVNSQADKAKARKAIVSSVEGKHPFKAGTFTADKYQTAFLAWSKTNLSEADQAQIQRVISLYDKTAAAAGLVSSNPRERQSLRTRHPRP